MKLWIDDLRPAPDESWIHIFTTAEAITVIDDQYAYCRKEPLILSLDDDAGECERCGGGYIEILKDMALAVHTVPEFKEYVNTQVTFHLHSANSADTNDMKRIIQRNGWKEASEESLK